MTLPDLYRLCTTRGLGFSIDPKLRPNDSAYVTVYSAGNHSHARKAFSTEAEMLAALEQCVGEVLPQVHPVDALRHCAEQIADASGLEVDQSEFDDAKQQYDDFSEPDGSEFG